MKLFLIPRKQSEVKAVRYVYVKKYLNDHSKTKPFAFLKVFLHDL